MKRFALPVLFSGLVLAALVFSACGKKTKQVQVYKVFQDIVGNSEFEEDGTYPPPANLDNFKDDLQTVTLHFGEDNPEGFSKDQVYGYYITTDDTDINYIFPYVPDGKYWLSAELVLADSCFFAKTATFNHVSDSTATRQDMRPVFLGLNQKCFDTILTAASEPVDYVQVGPRTWINKKVYDQYYKDSEAGKALLNP